MWPAGRRLRQEVRAIRSQGIAREAAVSGMVAMNKRRLRAKALLLVTILCVTCVLIACHGDRRESFYPAFADAERDGAITRGWIPYFLPESARAIHEVHDISPSTEWCAFEFSPGDSERLRRSLKGVDALPRSVQRVPKPGVSWWPVLLQGNLEVEKIHRAGFELQMFERSETAVSTEVLLFALDWQKGRGFFYSTSR